MHPIETNELWHAEATLIVAIFLQLTISEHLQLGPKYMVATLLLFLVAAIAFTAPKRHIAKSHTHITLATLLIALVSIANAGELALLTRALIDGSQMPGKSLLSGALAIFLTNIIVFALWYWELDSPGLSGIKKHDASPKFQFPNMQDEISRIGKWEPKFSDYLYVSLTNGTAFSPTDTMPLTHGAKLLMSAQALISLLTVVLVTARAVNILG